MTTFGQQKGVSLIAAIFIIVILAFMGVMFVSLIGTSSLTSVNDLQSGQALYVAEGGLERAVRFLDSPILDPTSTNLDRRRACASVTGDVALTNVALGSGQFTVTTEVGSPFYPANAVTFTNIVGTTINVSADPIARGYASSGRIMIDRELIDYSGTLGNSFTGVVRGRDGSAVSVHANGAPVGQYQCTVTSQGGIPTVAAPAALRTVREALQLQEGWAVGGGGLPTDNLNSVYCTGAANCWAVGDAGTILRWNGVGWSQVVSPTVENLNEVHCADANNCWAVGNAGVVAAERPLLLQWDGAAWAIFNSGLNINADLNSVFCNAPNDCWSVGDRTANNNNGWMFLRWNGLIWQRTQTTAPNSTAQGLLSVFMLDTNYGWAVGGPNNDRFVRWNGANWVNNFPGAVSQLNSVFLLSANNGWAVGDVQGGNEVVYQWDGANWTRLAASGIIPNQNLESVFCTSNNECFVAGANGTISRWSGAVWTNVSPGGNQLNSVVTIDTTGDGIADDGWAVGAGGVIFRWNGAAWNLWAQANATLLRWRDVAWNDVSATLPLSTNRLRAISMLSYADGWAVGSRTGGTTNGWMFRRWSNPVANAWNDFGVDTAPTIAQNLNAVYMISSNDGWAVGNRTGATTNGWILLGWNGAGWGRFAVDTAPTVAQNLNAVYTISSNDGWAVGNRTGAATNGWILLRWNGAGWSRFAVDTAPTIAQNLNAVYLVSGGNDGWAVGDSNGARPVVLRWNLPCGGGAGTGTWNDCTNGIPAVNQNLNSVFMVGADDGWAAGDGGLLLHWNGTAWTQIPPPTLQNLDSVYVIGPRQRPQAAWQEVIQ